MLSNLLALDRPPETMTCTIQKELAERIVAQPRQQGLRGVGHLGAEPVPGGGGADPGPLGILAAAQGLLGLSAHRARPAARARIADLGFFHDFVRAMFLHRRKFLRSQLLSACRDRLDKAGVDRLLLEQGLDGTDRAEQLDPDTMLALCEAVRGEGLGIRGQG